MLQQKSDNLSLHTIETLAVERYRPGTNCGSGSANDGLPRTRGGVDALFKEHGVYLDYTDADIDCDLRRYKRVLVLTAGVNELRQVNASVMNYSRDVGKPDL